MNEGEDGLARGRLVAVGRLNKVVSGFETVGLILVIYNVYSRQLPEIRIRAFNNVKIGSLRALVSRAIVAAIRKVFDEMGDNGLCELGEHGHHVELRFMVLSVANLVLVQNKPTAQLDLIDNLPR